MGTIQHEPPATQEDTHARVRFELDDPALGDAEVLWARTLSAETAELDNIPLLIFGVSLGDTIKVRHDDGWLVYNGVETGGGHSTYRVMLSDPDGAETKERFREIVTHGCVTSS
jgi:Domain of unknown function (DUF4265)